jgi:iron complex outermembrane receptor protein
MDYKNQLVLTGEINDVGYAIMANVPTSYRTGIEISASAKLFKRLLWEANATVSKNEILNFTEYVDDWDTWSQRANFLGKTDIAFSPAITAMNHFGLDIVKGLRLDITSNYVGKQYIDNTSSDSRSLHAYLINNAQLSYTLHLNFIKEIQFSFMLNNFLNEQYESNAWVYPYYYNGQEAVMDGYFPQAGINFLGGVKVKI